MRSRKTAAVRTLEVDLAEGGGVEESDPFTGGKALPSHRRTHLFSRLREVPGTQPLPHRLEYRPLRLVPLVHRGDPERIVELAGGETRRRSEGDRGIGRAEGRRADLRRGAAERTGREGHAVHVPGLPLVGAEPEKGVPLDVLDGLEAFTHREREVGGGRVVLEVDKGPARPRAPRMDRPRRVRIRRSLLVRGRGGDDSDIPEAGRESRFAAGLRALAHAGVEAERAAAGARPGLRLHRRTGQETAPGSRRTVAAPRTAHGDGGSDSNLPIRRGGRSRGCGRRCRRDGPPARGEGRFAPACPPPHARPAPGSRPLPPAPPARLRAPDERPRWPPPRSSPRRGRARPATRCRCW